jgi:nucleoporin NUP2
MPASDPKPKSIFSFPPSGPSPTVNGTISALSHIEAEQDEVDYWKKLRGLNVSFLAKAQDLFEEDLFADLSELFEGYCKIRNDLNEKRAVAKASSSPPVTANATAAGGFSFAGKSISLGSLVPPTSTAASTTGVGGFMPLTKGFSFGVKTVSFTSDSGSSAVAGVAGSSQSTSIDVDEFESDKEDEKMDNESRESAANQSSLSKFGVATKGMDDGASSASMGGSSISFSSFPDAKPIPSFGRVSSSFGKFPSSFGLPPPGTTKPPEKKDKSPASTALKTPFGFGLPAPGSTTASTSDSNPVIGFGLPPPGTTHAPTSTSGLTQDEKKPAGIGTFSFGNLPTWSSFAKDPSDSNTSSGGPKAVSIGGPSLFTGAAGFGFGAVPPTPAGGTPGTETPALQSDGGTGGGEDYVPSIEQRYDVDGPGEEDEETIGGTSWRAKIWQLGKARGEDGKEKEGAGVEWSDFGVSFVRLKKHKTTGAKRILARHTKTGHIVMVSDVESGSVWCSLGIVLMRRMYRTLPSSPSCRPRLQTK